MGVGKVTGERSFEGAEQGLRAAELRSAWTAGGGRPHVILEGAMGLSVENDCLADLNWRGAAEII